MENNQNPINDVNKITNDLSLDFVFSDKTEEVKNLFKAKPTQNDADLEKPINFSNSEFKAGCREIILETLKAVTPYEKMRRDKLKICLFSKMKNLRKSIERLSMSEMTFCNPEVFDVVCNKMDELIQEINNAFMRKKTSQMTDKEILNAIEWKNKYRLDEIFIIYGDPTQPAIRENDYEIDKDVTKISQALDFSFHGKTAFNKLKNKLHDLAEEADNEIAYQLGFVERPCEVQPVIQGDQKPDIIEPNFSSLLHKYNRVRKYLAEKIMEKHGKALPYHADVLREACRKHSIDKLMDVAQIVANNYECNFFNAFLVNLGEEQVKDCPKMYTYTPEFSD